MTQVVATLDAVSPVRTAVICLHCGDDCGPRPTMTRRGPFCCAGCATVHELIVESGLAQFYACDVPPGPSQRQRAGADAYAAFDDPAIAARMVGPAGAGARRVSFIVPAMHCASCVWLLEQLWRVVPGVVRAEVDLLKRELVVDFDPAGTTLRRIADRLAALGYPPAIDAERGGRAVAPARRQLYARIGVAGFAFGNMMLFSLPRYLNGAPLAPFYQQLFNTLNLAFAVPVLAYSAAPYFRAAWQAVRLRMVTLDVPVGIGLFLLFARSLSDMIAGRGEGFLDSFSGLVFFLLVGKLFQEKSFDRIAFDRTVRSFLPLSIGRATPDGVVLTPIERLAAGDEIVVRPHEVVPADALMLDDDGRIDYAFATGESRPVPVRAGEAVPAGGRVVGAAVRLRVLRAVEQSRLVALWQHAASGRAGTPWFTEVSRRFGWWFTVAALALAAAGAAWWWPDPARAASVATAVLIIACPCALTLAAPIALGTAMGVLGRAGCYLSRPAVVLELSRVDTVVFDKTGTLTMASGDGGVVSTLREADRHLVSRLAAHSTHPVSRVLAADRSSAGVTDVVETPGAGVAGIVDGHRVRLGKAAFVDAGAAQAAPGGRRTWASIDGRLAGWIEVDERRRPGVERAVRALGASRETWLMSGDGAAETEAWRPIFGARVRFSLSPEDKAAEIAARRAAGARVLMVGDGLNDMAALRAADVGLAVSEDAACLVPACDGVLSATRVTDVPALLAYAAWTRRVIVLCFAVSVVYNLVGLSLALSGRLTPLATAVLMPVSSLSIVAISHGLTRMGFRTEARA